jgi:glucose uptake protein
MISINNYLLAIFLCVLAMTCWGSWQNTRNVAGLKWRFKLFYWDFIAGIFLFSLLMAFTFGSLGSEGRTFIADIQQAHIDPIGSAMLGGAIWNIGTLLLTAAIAMTGMSVEFPIGGGAGWVLGILILYLGKPEGNPIILFSGCLIIIGAIVFSMLSYKMLAKQHLMGILGGAIWCLCMSVSFMANQAASPATAYDLSNAAPVVAAIWGIFVWKEFSEVPKRPTPCCSLCLPFS